MISRYVCLLKTSIFSLIFLLCSCGGGSIGSDEGGQAIVLEPKDEVIQSDHNSANQLYPTREFTRLNGQHSLSCEINTQPLYGVIDETDSCVFTYTPNTGFLGQEIVSLTISEADHSSVIRRQRIRYIINVNLLNTIVSADVENLFLEKVRFVTGGNVYYDVASAGVGNFNDDEFNDIVIRSRGDLFSSLDVAVIYGRTSFDKEYDLSPIREKFLPNFGFQFSWEYDLGGNMTSVNKLGDFNGDGHSDIIIGDTSNSETLVVFGGAESDNLQVKIQDNSRHDLGLYTERFVSIPGNFFVAKSKGVGDFNGDGLDDLAYFGTPGASISYQAFHVVPGDSNLSALPNSSQSSDIYTFQTLRSDDHRHFKGRTFASVMPSSIGDINGDGFDDILVSDYLFDKDSSEGEHSTGRAYVFFGSSNWDNVTEIPNDASEIDGGLVIEPSAEHGFNFGECIGLIEDINGDGYDEMSIAANSNNSIGSGFVNIVFGDSNHSKNIVVEKMEDAQISDQASVMTILGAAVCETKSIGDINADGFNDLVVVNKHENYIHPSEFYIIYGSDDLPRMIDLSVSSQHLTRVDVDGSVISVSSAGDVNGDNYDDFIIAVAEPGESVYVVFGGDYFVRHQ